MRKNKEVGVGHEADQKQEDGEQVKSLRFKCNPVCLFFSFCFVTRCGRKSQESMK